MCDLCRELDYKIEACRRLENSTNDELTREAVADLIREYEEDKAKLHPNQSGEASRS
jgi:U3 small nucleolar RNA-associated protein 14